MGALTLQASVPQGVLFGTWDSLCSGSQRLVTCPLAVPPAGAGETSERAPLVPVETVLRGQQRPGVACSPPARECPRDHGLRSKGLRPGAWAGRVRTAQEFSLP